MHKAKDTGSDIYVWDWVVRVCHWGIVASFITNYFIVEPGRLFHEIAGYVGVALISIRVAWGLRSANPNKKGSAVAGFLNESLEIMWNIVALPAGPRMLGITHGMLRFSAPFGPPFC